MKLVSIYFSAIILVIFSTISCNNNSATTETHKESASSFDMVALRKIIDEKNNQFTRSHITGDTAFMNNIFTQDAKVFAPNAEVVTGRTAISALNLEYIGFGINEFREETTALYGSGDYLVNEGSYFMSYGKDSTQEKGKFINIWKKVDGDWKIHSNIWNTNAPAK